MKMEESEGVRFDIFYLFSFYFSRSVEFNISFASREERQEFDFLASNEAVEYLANVTPEDWSGIHLSEMLMTRKGDKDFGEFEIGINSAVWQGRECYMIHVTEENIVNDVPKVTNIIAHVDRTFTTLEQSIHEYIKIPERTIDIKTLMVLEGGKYVVQKTVKQEELPSSSQKYENYTLLTQHDL